MYITKEPLYGNRKAKFLLVKDSNSPIGLKTLKTVIKLYCNEMTPVKIFCYDGSAENLLDGMSTEIDILVYDMLSNSHKFFDENKSHAICIDEIEKELMHYKGVACFYSLTSLLIHNGVENVYKSLHKLLNMNSDLQVVALLYPSVLNSFDDHIIERLCTTSLNVDAEEELCRMQCVIHYINGRVSSSNVEFEISETFDFLNGRDVKVQKKKVPTKQPDPTANLTFNLRLKDEEKKARNQVHLPYMKKCSEDDVTSVLLEEDFYDEDDPDDDLDI